MIGPTAKAESTTETANSRAHGAYFTNSGPYSSLRSVGAATKTATPHATEAASPAPVTNRDTFIMPVQPRSASCLVASGKPKLPLALITSVVGPATSPCAAFKPPSAAGTQNDTRKDEIELTRPPTGGTLAGQPPTRGPTRPQKVRSAANRGAHRELPETVESGNRRSHAPGRDNGEDRMQTGHEDHPERQRLDGIEEEVVHERLPRLPLHEADPSPVILQIEHDYPWSHGKQAHSEGDLADNEEGRAHGGDDACGHHSERHIRRKPAPDELLLLVPAHVTHDGHRVGDQRPMQRRQQDPDRVREGEGPEPAGPLIRATTIPTAKFDAEATHWSAMVIVARLAALPRRGHRVLNSVADMLVTGLGLREQGTR